MGAGDGDNAFEVEEDGRIVPARQKRLEELKRVSAEREKADVDLVEVYARRVAQNRELDKEAYAERVREKRLRDKLRLRPNANEEDAEEHHQAVLAGDED